MMVMLVLSPTVTADNGLKRFTWELIYELKRELPAARAMSFVVLPGAPKITVDDERMLAAHFDKLGVAKQPEARAVLKRYQRMRGQSMPFRADPVEIPTLSGPRHICVLKLDSQSQYSMESMLSLLRVERPELEKAGVDISGISVARIQQHIASHELWHCLEMVQQEAYIKFALSLTNVQLADGGGRLLLDLLRNHAEIGADLFATLLDMRNFGGCDMKELMIAVRETNLRKRQDVEHYTAPALEQVRTKLGSALAWRSLSDLIDQVQAVRRNALDPLVFAGTWREVNQGAGNSLKQDMRLHD